MYVPCITKTREIIKDFLKRACITHVSTQDNNQLRKKSHQMSEEKREQIICSQYDLLPETRAFTSSSGGMITSAQKCVYIGTTLHFSLQDTHIIQACLTKAAKVMGALNFYWNSNEVELWAKVRIYQACVLLVLLWGSKNWALTENF